MNDEDRKKVKKLAPQGFTSTVGKSFFFREKRFCHEIKKSRKLELLNFKRTKDLVALA